MNGEINIWQVIEGLGVIGILALMLHLFYTGKLISSSVNDKIIGVYKKQAEVSNVGVCKKLDELIKRSSEDHIKIANKLGDIHRQLEINGGSNQ